LEIKVHFHGHGGRQGIHVEKVDAIGDIVLDDHPLGIAFNKLRGGSGQLIGQQKGRRFVAKVGNDNRMGPWYPQG
jgi:hypothetical protein